MSLLRKFLSSNLSRYEEEQKRRYKKYVKIKKQEAKVVLKTEAEVYEDGIERRRSSRLSKRRAPLPNEEIVFREPTSGLSLGPAPAILEAINRYVVIEKVPEAYLKDIVLRYVIPRKERTTAEEGELVEEVVFVAENTLESGIKIKELPAIPKRKKSGRSVDHQTSMIETTETNRLEKREENVRLSLPNRDVIQKYQALEIGRISISTTNSDAFFDCLDESLGSCKSLASITNEGAEKFVKDINEEISEQQNEPVASREIAASKENLVWKVDSSIKEDMVSNEVIHRQREQSLLHPASLDEEINSLWENIGSLQLHPKQNEMDEISTSIGDVKEETVTINEHLAITKESIAVEDSRWKPEQEIRIYESNLHSAAQKPTISFAYPLEEDVQITDDVLVYSENDDGALIESFNDYVVIEPILAQSFNVSKEKIKFDESNGENMIDFSDLYDDEAEEGIMLHDRKTTEPQKQNSRSGSSSSEDDVFQIKTDRKVNFDFANSFCTTYEPVRQPSSSDEASLTSTTTDDDSHRLYNVLSVGNQMYLEAPPEYRDIAAYRDNAYDQKDNVFKSFGVNPDQRSKTSLEPIYENVQGMDLALLNCKNGYRETEITDDEEPDQLSEHESLEYDINNHGKFQEYYDRIGDFNGDKVNSAQIKREPSISEIQDDLIEIKNLEDVVTQIDRIQDVLNKISSQIEYLESKDDENYTTLLKTLLNSMKILGNLNCNFDEELLKFQQDSMEHISQCIKSLQAL